MVSEHFWPSPPIFHRIPVIVSEMVQNGDLLCYYVVALWGFGVIWRVMVLSKKGCSGLDSLLKYFN